MKKKLKTLSTIIRTTAIILTLLLVKQTAVINYESKSSNTNLNKSLDLHAMAQKIAEIEHNELYTPLDVYNGRLTGYAADCPLCGGTLGCNGQNVLDRTINYSDNQYGLVRIVASSTSLPCGTIVQFTLNQISSDPVTAIVLDRGVTGTSLDLLVENESYAINNVGSSQISYNILRFGYKR